MKNLPSLWTVGSEIRAVTHILPLAKRIEFSFHSPGSRHAVRNSEWNKYSAEQRVEERLLFSTWYPAETNVANISKHKEDLTQKVLELYYSNVTAYYFDPIRHRSVQSHMNK